MNIPIPTPRDFSFRRTALSHGWYDLPPFSFDRDGWTLVRVLDTGNGAPVTVKITATPHALNVSAARRLSQRAVTRIAGIKLTDEMTVTRWDPPRLLEVRHHKPPVLGDAWFEVVPDGAGARVEWVENLELPFGKAGELAGNVARAPVEWGLKKSLSTLRDLIEREG